MFEWSMKHVTSPWIAIHGPDTPPCRSVDHSVLNRAALGRKPNPVLREQRGHASEDESLTTKVALTPSFLKW